MADYSQLEKQRVLRYFNSAGSAKEIEQTLKISGISDGKAAVNILNKRKILGLYTDLDQISGIKGIGPERLSGIAEVLAPKDRLIADPSDLVRNLPMISGKVNKDARLGQLMLIDPARLLEEELGFMVSEDMKDELVKAYAGKRTAKTDGFYDRVKKGVSDLGMLKNIRLIPKKQGPNGTVLRTDTAPKKTEVTTKRRTPNPIGDFDFVFQLRDDVPEGIAQFCYWENLFPREFSIPFGADEMKVVIGPITRVYLNEQVENPDFVILLPVALDIGLSNQMLTQEKYVSGSMRLRGSVSTTELDGNTYAAFTLRDVEAITLLISGIEMPFDTSTDDAARSNFNAIVNAILSGQQNLPQALTGDPWGYLEDRLSDVLEDARIPLSQILRQVETAAGEASDAKMGIDRVEIADFEVGTLGSVPGEGHPGVLAACASMNMYKGNTKVYGGKQAQLRGVKSFIEAGSNGAAGINGAVIEKAIKAYWDKNLKNTTRDDTEIHGLSDISVEDGYVRMKFGVTKIRTLDTYLFGECDWCAPDIDADVEIRISFEIDPETLRLVAHVEKSSVDLDNWDVAWAVVVGFLELSILSIVMGALVGIIAGLIGGAVVGICAGAITAGAMFGVGTVLIINDLTDAVSSADSDAQEDVEAALNEYLPVLETELSIPGSDATVNLIMDTIELKKDEILLNGLIVTPDTPFLPHNIDMEIHVRTSNSWIVIESWIERPPKGREGRKGGKEDAGGGGMSPEEIARNTYRMNRERLRQIRVFSAVPNPVWLEVGGLRTRWSVEGHQVTDSYENGEALSARVLQDGSLELALYPEVGETISVEVGSVVEDRFGNHARGTATCETTGEIRVTEIHAYGKDLLHKPIKRIVRREEMPEKPDRAPTDPRERRRRERTDRRRERRAR